MSIQDVEIVVLENGKKGKAFEGVASSFIRAAVRMRKRGSLNLNKYTFIGVELKAISAAIAA